MGVSYPAGRGSIRNGDNMRGFVIGLVAVVVVGLAGPASAADKFSSCSKLLAKFPTGVARDQAAATAAEAAGMRRPTVSRKVYAVNARNLDRDGDGIACEQTS